MDWYCPNCGAENNGGFCENCGTAAPAVNVPEHMLPPGYNGAELYEAHLALEKKEQRNKNIKTFFIVLGAVFAAIVLFFVGMIIFGMTISDEEVNTPEPKTSVEAPASVDPEPEPEPEPFMGYMSKLGTQAYLDVVSIEPAVGVSLEINDTAPTKYGRVVCACGKADGSTEYVIMKAEDYNTYIDPDANVTDIDSISFEKVEFSPAKRIHGKVSSTALIEGLKDQITNPKILEFESIQ